MTRSHRRSRSILTALVIATAWVIVRAGSTAHALEQLQTIGAAGLEIAPASTQVVARPREARASERTTLRSFVAPAAQSGPRIECARQIQRTLEPRDRAPFSRLVRAYDATAPPQPLASFRSSAAIHARAIPS